MTAPTSPAQPPVPERLAATVWAAAALQPAHAGGTFATGTNLVRVVGSSALVRVDYLEWPLYLWAAPTLLPPRPPG